jgi:hypothetical protein
MKKLLLSTVMLLMTCIISCTDQNKEMFNMSKNALEREAVKAWFETSRSKAGNNDRVNGSRFANLEPIWSLAKDGVTRSGAKCLEIPLKYPNEQRMMTNLGTGGAEDLLINPPKLCMVVYLEKGVRITTIKEIRPSIEYDREYRGRIFKDKFSGKVLVWNWNGELIGGSFYENGKRLGSIEPVSGKGSARTSAVICETVNECHWSSYCYEFAGPGGAGNPVIIYGTQTYGYNISCHPPDDYGHRDGMAQCSGWEITATYTYNQCYNTPDPGDGGEGTGPGEVDTFEGFPTNPSDGQQFTYTNPSGNSTTFTYHGSLRMWMLPEVTALKAQGYFLQIPGWNQQFTGALLTAYALPLGFEPTQIGKVVIAGAAVIYAGLYIYSQLTVIDYLRDNPHRQHCITLYERCATNTPSSPCSSCLQFCNTQGYWDFSNCPNVNLVQ